MELTILPKALDEQCIAEIEATGAKYLLDSELLHIDSVGERWLGIYAIFYNYSIPNQYEYFGVNYDNFSKPKYPDAKPTIEQPIVAVMSDEGECIYSSHRYDFHYAKDGSVAIDGGRSYTRTIGNIRNKKVLFRIIEDLIIPVCII